MGIIAIIGISSSKWAFGNGESEVTAYTAIPFAANQNYGTVEQKGYKPFGPKGIEVGQKNLLS